VEESSNTEITEQGESSLLASSTEIKKARRPHPPVELITRHISDIARDCGVSEGMALRVCQGFLRKIVQRLTADDWPEGGHLVLSNIGRFEWRHWEARHGYNPRARKAMIIPAQRKLRFVPAKQFGIGEPLRALNATVAGIDDSGIMPAAPRKKRRRKVAKPAA
jgi:nucleoid DNA-binding protein